VGEVLFVESIDDLLLQSFVSFIYYSTSTVFLENNMSLLTNKNRTDPKRNVKLHW
jgi:hypothetical protein